MCPKLTIWLLSFWRQSEDNRKRADAKKVLKRYGLTPQLYLATIDEEDPELLSALDTFAFTGHIFQPQREILMQPIVFGSNAETAQINDPVGNRDSESLGDGMAGSSDGADRLGGIPGSLGETGATGEGNIVTAGQQSPSETRDIAGVRAESIATGSEPELKALKKG